MNMNRNRNGNNRCLRSGFSWLAPAISLAEWEQRRQAGLGQYSLCSWAGPLCGAAQADSSLLCPRGRETGKAVLKVSSVCSQFCLAGSPSG